MYVTITTLKETKYCMNKRYEIISLTVQSRWSDDDDDDVVDVEENRNATSWKHTIKITILFNVMQH